MDYRSLFASILIIFASGIFLFTFLKNTGHPARGEDRNLRKVNIFLITLESTRADHLPCYGYHRNTTPNICEIARDAVLFENAYSQGTWTGTAIPPLLTSLRPSGVSLAS